MKAVPVGIALDNAEIIFISAVILLYIFNVAFKGFFIYFSIGLSQYSLSLRKLRISDIKPEKDDISVVHDVVLALASY